MTSTLKSDTETSRVFNCQNPNKNNSRIYTAFAYRDSRATPAKANEGRARSGRFKGDILFQQSQEMVETGAQPERVLIN